MTGREQLAGWEDPRHVLKRHGLAPNRAFSQSFLISPAVAEAILAALAPRDGERVLEIGPGPGTLTGPLLRAGAHVTAIERERGMIALLQAERGAGGALDVIAANAADMRIDTWISPEERPVAVVGNLPYAITGRILRGLVEQANEVSRAVIMVQREVRDRLLATPATSAYGALTVFTQAIFHVEPVRLVPRGCFHPAPKVDSAVVALCPREVPVALPTGAFQRIVRAVFDARRKTLRKALRQVAATEHVDAALADAAVDGTRRGETLSIEELATLARHWRA